MTSDKHSNKTQYDFIQENALQINAMVADEVPQEAWALSQYKDRLSQIWGFPC